MSLDLILKQYQSLLAWLMGQAFLLLIKQAIEVDGLDHHLLCPIMHCINEVLINEVPKFLVLIPSAIMHTIQIMNPFDATHPIIIPLELAEVTSYFDV